MAVAWPHALLLSKAKPWQEQQLFLPGTEKTVCNACDKPITANLRYWDIGILPFKKPLRNKVVHNIILG